MRSTRIHLALVVLGLGAGACGYNGTAPTQPDVPPPAGSIVVDIVRTNGAQSFSPNPATIPAGRVVVWHNVDTTTHRVVLDDRGVDTGDIAPGRFSAPMTLTRVGPYHCTIHPEMVGTINEG